MPNRFLTNAEKERLESFPAEIGEVDKTAFFTLTDTDSALISEPMNKIGSLILADEITDERLREKIFQALNPQDLSEAVAECPVIMRPGDDNYFDLWASRYSYFRRFVPHFLETLEFASDPHHEDLRQAVELLKKMNIEGRRKLPEDTPSFIHLE